MLRKNELYAKLKKYEFWLGKVSFSGHVVSREGIFMDLQKIEVVTQWPRPKNAIEVGNFLGLVCYYREFV